MKSALAIPVGLLVAAWVGAMNDAPWVALGCVLGAMLSALAIVILDRR